MNETKLVNSTRVLEIAQYIAKRRIHAFKPYYLRQNLEFEASSVLDEQIVRYLQTIRTLQLESGNPKDYEDCTKIHLPDGDPKIPFYRPRFTTGTYDDKLLNAIAFQWLASKETQGNFETAKGYVVQRDRIADPTDMDTTIKRCRQACIDYRLSSGTWQGQLARLKDMQNIRHGVDGKFLPKSLKELGYDLESFSKILEKTLPINAVDLSQTISLRYLPTLFIEETEVEVKGVKKTSYIDNTPKLKPDSKAGPPFQSKYRKGDMFSSILALADDALLGLSEVIHGRMDRHKYFKDRIYLAMCFLFPKEERYEASKLTTKTRNIASVCGVTHYLMLHAMEPVMEKSKWNCMSSETYENPSLSKFTPYFGNLQKFLDFGLHREKKKVFMPRGAKPTHRDFIYADNWYIFYRNEDGTTDYYSLDLEKGEANATPDIAQCISYYLLTRGWISDDGIVGFGPTWSTFLTQIVPACIVDNISVYYNMQLRFPGQASGNTYTFLINHAVTTKLRQEWLNRGCPRPGSAEFTQCCKKTGVNTKIEFHSENLEQQVKETIANTPNVGFLQGDSTDSVDANGQSWFQKALPRLKLDLLGYDAVYSHQLGIFIPVLAEERFYPSMMWPRKGGETIKDYIQRNLYNLVRYEVLRIMGGWTIPLADQALHNMATNIRTNIVDKRHKMDTSTFLGQEDLAPDLWGAMEDSGLTTELALNPEFSMTHELLTRLNTPKQTSPEHMPVKPKPRHLSKPELMADLQELKKSLTNLTSSHTEKLLAKPEYVRSKLEEVIKTFPSLEAIITIMGKYEDLYSELDEVYNNKMKIEDFMDKLTHWINQAQHEMEEAMRKSIRVVQQAQVQDYENIEAFYEKDPTKLADPLGYKGAQTLVGKHTFPESSSTIPASLTKSQKKNLKKKQRISKLRDIEQASWSRDALGEIRKHEEDL
ncbi:RNA-dependent RNA polymerase [Drosophila B birnavirus]|uniref:RNA-directed RNA polymerase n=1 Tax=Drosophila B birnavirus TaxID=3070834 RepID=D0U496_9VIRU|nr:RNA-dependent RNA polymerase [Drosophila melanogaster birnavirus SW-2009a]ACU32792.1 RNA-dependent RNA polymerase [Drosophila melanogaster birnavirus SW-2009a]